MCVIISSSKKKEEEGARWNINHVLISRLVSQLKHPTLTKQKQRVLQQNLAWKTRNCLLSRGGSLEGMPSKRMQLWPRYFSFHSGMMIIANTLRNYFRPHVPIITTTFDIVASLTFVFSPEMYTSSNCKIVQSPETRLVVSMRPRARQLKNVNCAYERGMKWTCIVGRRTITAREDITVAHER